MSELVIGLVAGGKHWDYVEAWVVSLRASGYAGDAALVTVNCEPDLHEECHKHDVRTFKAGKEEFMTRHRQNFPAGRFLPLGNAIADAYPEHFVLATDVRDVVFQRNPFEWFAERYSDDSYRDRLFATSEEVAHDDGTIAGNWNAARIEQLFGARMRYGAQGTPVYNAGVMCAQSSLLTGLMRTIWLMCFSFKGAGGDQAAYNLLLQLEPYTSIATPLRLEDAWAIHFGGISRGAVQEERLPRYEDGLVKNAAGNAFHILHQYNRVPEALELVRSRLDEMTAKG